MLSLPILRDSNPVGAITVTRREVSPFSQAQIDLLKTFADQAVIAIENVQLFNETREALEQQTATAEVLQVINSSPRDLTPVFEAILEKAHSLCGVAAGTLQIFDGEFSRVVADRGLPEPFARELRQGYRYHDNPMIQPLIAGEPFGHIPDLAAINHPASRYAVEVGNTRTLLVIPLRKGDALFGVIAAGRRQVQPFTAKQIALLQNFAAQAVIAMENARLLTETREALEQQTATAEVLQVINSSPGNLTPVFDAILERALSVCEAAFGGISTYDGERFHVMARRGATPEYLDFVQTFGAPPPSPNSGLWRIAHGERIVHIVDIADDDVYRAGDPLRVATVDLLGGRTCVWVALHKEGRLLGMLNAYRRQVRPFTDKQIGLLQNFAAQAAIAMENARLLGELRERTEEVAEFNRGLEARVAEQVDELGRVGRLKRFLAPQLAELIVSQGDENILESHRREIVVVFCDLRGYTAFTETAEPEEVLDFLREYHGALGPLVSQYEGTLDQFVGDGIMVIFNDPVPVPDPAERAVNMAVTMREVALTLLAAWRERGRELGFGIGIAQGYATLGQIGFAERAGYTAIGTVCNVAARLCAQAEDGQILLSQRVNVALKGSVAAEQVGAFALKGLAQPVVAYNVPLAAK
jgi:class 3 adenylate cyclase